MSSYSSFFLTGSDFFFSGFFCFGGCIVEEDCPRELFVACFVGGGCFGDAWEGMSSLSPPELNGSGGDGEHDVMVVPIVMNTALEMMMLVDAGISQQDCCHILEDYYAKCVHNMIL
jgi:hypothetical protein